MPYCSRCGVEVHEAVNHCPLCEAPIQKLPMKNGLYWPAEEAGPPPIPPMSPDERIALTRIITTLGFLIPVSIVLTVDWFINRQLGWSLYAVLSLGAVWLWAILPLAIQRRPYLLTLSCSLVGIALLSGIALLTGNFSWLPGLGIPILAGAGGLVMAVVGITRHTQRRGSNVAAWILFALVIFSFGTDLLVSLYQSGQAKPGWSIIVAATLIPISLLLIYIHYRPSRQTRIRRYFHV